MNWRRGRDEELGLTTNGGKGRFLVDVVEDLLHALEPPVKVVKLRLPTTPF